MAEGLVGVFDGVNVAVALAQCIFYQLLLEEDDVVGNGDGERTAFLGEKTMECYGEKSFKDNASELVMGNTLKNTKKRGGREERKRDEKIKRT